MIAVLKAEGFRRAGRFTVIPTRGVRLIGDRPTAAPGNYAFGLDGEVAYVGKAANIMARLGSYVYDFGVHSGIRQAHVEMRKALEDGRVVDLWVREAEWVTLASGTRIAVFADLENHLIKTLKPAWNVVGLTGRGTRVVERKPAPRCRDWYIAA